MSDHEGTLPTLDVFTGWPVYADESLPPGTVQRERGAIYAHPTVIYAFRIVQVEHDLRTFDPWVMELASIVWQEERIQAAADAAVRRLSEIMRQQDLRRGLRMDPEAKRAELHDRMLDWHPGVEHTWTRDLLRLTVTCQECGGIATYEQMHRMGAAIPDVWRAAVDSPVVTAAFERAMGARR